MNIYKAELLQSLQTFYGDLLHHGNFDSIYDHLEAMADKMLEGTLENETSIFCELNNYNPKFIGIKTEELANYDFDKSDCRDTIAAEYGFQSWKEVEALQNTKYNHDFENAVDALLNGDLDKLKGLISKSPDILQTKSQYGHKASLLHYAGSNGVEMWRQQVPFNLPQIVTFLIKFGAEINAKMLVYGDEFTTLEMVTSSAHPYKAGIAEKLIKTLKE